MTTPCITSRSLARILWYLRGDADLAVVVVGVCISKLSGNNAHQRRHYAPLRLAKEQYQSIF
jgi:hypothetical protein